MPESLYLSGQWQSGRGPGFHSHDPATGQVVWSGASAGEADVDLALKAGRAAFEHWALTPFPEREALCRRFAELVKRDTEALARTIALETGKPLWESRTEVAAMVNKVEISVQAYLRRTGSQEAVTGSVTSRLTHRPHGVVAVFGPYNFPGHLPNGHIVPALLAGNCVLFKPSELAPLMAIETVKRWHEAGVPPGVLQLLVGERATGEAIARHPDLSGLYFTGSSRTGQILRRQFADTPGRILALEMGGNNPLIVGHISEMRAAVYDVIQSAYLSAGQRCTCARRLFVPAGASGDAFVDRLAEAARAIEVGHPFAEPPPFMGPVISAKAADALLAAQERLIEAGARPILAMRRLEAGPAFLSPGLVDVSSIVERLPDEEDFGPLLKLVRYTHFEDAIRLANATRYGLSAALLSEDGDQWRVFYTRIRAGIVNRNRQTTGASSAAPFGGIGASGNHRPSAFYAADYCAYPVASMEATKSELPASLAPGVKV